MTAPVIKVESLSKKFILSHEAQEKYTTLRDVITRRVKKLSGRSDKRMATKEEFWALNDVSFEIEQGDRVGIIGRNGAGKSTLLKVLSRITDPTAGRISIRGRVASLLEVGTGFHPELSGRENIFLNGAILGMSRAEIRKKFDEIVAFAEIEKFLDTPVKRYSSGMYVRLAFAVAAHLEPEILIVDEVLAVGDAQFQKKCLGKMEDVSKNQGRTVLFVSHQIGTIAQLCDKTMLLKKGALAAFESTSRVIDKYLSKESYSESNKYKSEKKLLDHYNNLFEEVYTVNENNKETEEFGFSESISVCCLIKLKSKNSNLKVGVTIQNIHGYYISTSIYEIEKEELANKDFITVKVTFPPNIIAPNSYYFRVALFEENTVYEILENICGIRVIDTGTELSRYEGVNYGSVVLTNKWELI
ncbi:ABC transporter ATP-binding protein [Paraflavitalea soli]|uniref:ABC transporter ATP-binding protein n=1 Tax=Paraflavitalea soli TaxID=2315862 RepID=A0A3B7MRG4_9BACT|nr:ABC transporter ATP-binding protein [Paraflavitalea soli]AXY77092.1 ABC transporter ATP-binding protein [Paraflavitalea soli]